MNLRAGLLGVILVAVIAGRGAASPQHLAVFAATDARATVTPSPSPTIGGTSTQTYTVKGSFAGILTIVQRWFFVPATPGPSPTPTPTPSPTPTPPPPTPTPTPTPSPGPTLAATLCIGGQTYTLGDYDNFQADSSIDVADAWPPSGHEWSNQYSFGRVNNAGADAAYYPSLAQIATWNSEYGSHYGPVLQLDPGVGLQINTYPASLANTALAANYTVGATTVVVTSNTGIAVGDTVKIGMGNGGGTYLGDYGSGTNCGTGSGQSYANCIQPTVTNISGTTITISRTFAFSHASGTHITFTPADVETALESGGSYAWTVGFLSGLLANNNSDTTGYWVYDSALDANTAGGDEWWPSDWTLNMTGSGVYNEFDNYENYSANIFPANFIQQTQQCDNSSGHNGGACPNPNYVRPTGITITSFNTYGTLVTSGYGYAAMFIDGTAETPQWTVYNQAPLDPIMQTQVSGNYVSPDPETSTSAHIVKYYAHYTASPLTPCSGGIATPSP